MPPIPWALICKIAKSRWLHYGLLILLVVWFKHDRDSWRTASRTQAIAYEAAQSASKAKQDLWDLREFNARSQFAEKFDALSELSRERARSAVDAYTRAHPDRVRRAERTDGSGQGPGAAGVPSDPGQPAEGGQAAELVALPRTDVDSLAEAAMQGALRQRFLTGLVDLGWAIPKSEADRLMGQPDFGNATGQPSPDP